MRSASSRAHPFVQRVLEKVGVDVKAVRRELDLVAEDLDELDANDELHRRPGGRPPAAGGLTELANACVDCVHVLVDFGSRAGHVDDAPLSLVGQRFLWIG